MVMEFGHGLDQVAAVSTEHCNQVYLDRYFLTLVQATIMQSKDSRPFYTQVDSIFCQLTGSSHIVMFYEFTSLYLV